MEIPPFTKSYYHPITYAGLCSAETPVPGQGTFHLWGLKDVDFRDLLAGNPLNLKWGKIGNLSPKQQINGLLEVEPLHFTCHAASDGTRVEKIELGASNSSFVPVPLPQPWEPFTTNLPTGEGSKKSEPDKVEQIMMLQKALKMDSADYYDVFSDLKFMGNNVGMLELPYGGPNPSDHGELAHIATFDPSTWNKAAGVLTMVMQPIDVGGNPPLPPPSPPNSNVVIGPFIQPHMGGFSSLHKGPSSAVKIAAVPPMPAIAAAPTPAASAGSSFNDNKPPTAAINSKPNAGPGSSSQSQLQEQSSSGSSKGENDGLRLLLSPWQQMMYVPPQQALVIDRMHSGARRFVVLDFGGPILLTDMIIPACHELVSLSIDIWLHREDTDGQRLVVAPDIGSRSLVVCDLQPPPICRYLKASKLKKISFCIKLKCISCRLIFVVSLFL